MRTSPYEDLLIDLPLIKRMDEAGSSHTNWTLIFDAAHGDDQESSIALERLLRRYWPSVYAYIRRSGRSIDEASDLTQTFVCDVVLVRNLFRHASPQRGRFRTLLLSSVEKFLADRNRMKRRDVRDPKRPTFQLNESAVAAIEGSKSLTAEQAFMAQWNATAIRRALDVVQRSCVSARLEPHWRIFEARVVKPMLFGDAPVPYSTLVEMLNLEDSGQAANMMVTVKRRFVRALIHEIGCTVSDPMQIEEELRELLREMEAKS